MKKIISLFVVLFGFLFFNAQNVLKIEYERVSKGGTVKVTGDIDKLPEHIRKKIEESRKKSINQTRKTNYTLFYSNENTFYTDFSKEKTEKEDEKIDQVSPNKKVITSFRRVSVPVKFYHKKGEKGIYMYRKSYNEEYYEYTEPQWKSVDYREDTQKIDDFECKLVDITDQDGRVYHVWYTEQVPISAGPYRFNDLPGLVLKIEAPTYTLYATKVSNDAQPSDVETLNPKLKIYKGEELAKKKAEMNKPKVTRKVIRL